jgi:hypothetical protein
MAFSCTEFALVSGDVGHPPYDVARQKLYFFIMEPTVQYIVGLEPTDKVLQRVLLSAGGAQRHTFIFGQKRGKPGGAAYWLGVEAKKGERIIPRSCPARFRLMFCSIIGCVVLDRLKRKNVLAFT